MNLDDLTCEDCGTRDDVSETTCPYQADINDREVPAVLCGDCCHERAQDI